MSDLTAAHFKNPHAARRYLESICWGEEPICPHCGTVGGHYRLKGKAHRPGVWKCKACREQFSVTVGTVFERSKIGLDKWLFAVHLICSSKKGYSAHQLHRNLGVTYKTAWFMAHRIREAMKSSSGGLLGSGGKIVEADETYWGTEKGKEVRAGGHHKMKILSLVERGGEKRSFHVPSVTAKTLRPLLFQNISESARLMTDEFRSYTKAGKVFAEHSVVNHAVKEYARGDVTTNTVESSFALLKRGLMGTFHQVGEQHLQRYIAEFDFRWNKRKINDGERAEAALRGIVGKRLTYSLTQGQELAPAAL